jgi:Alginate lyase
MFRTFASSLQKWPIVLLLIPTASQLCIPRACADADLEPAKTVFWDGAHLAAVRAGKLNDNARIKKVLERLHANAGAAVENGPYSVMQKKEVASSGDRHDYLSYARYWWPNPKTPDGLPYVRHDGRTNDEALAKGDRGTIGRMYDDVETLALAGYVLNERRYADRAATLVRAWFIDPATKMNPHMRYGQAIPGLTEGRGSGIIDTRHFIRVLDSVSLLKDTGGWTDGDSTALVAWMKQYLDWLQNDPQAVEERDGDNNHGTWYDAQLAAIAMHVGERDVARTIVESAKANRVGKSIEPDGSQPEELARTKSLHYCVFNLSAMSVLARIGEQVDVDLWAYSTHDGRSIRRALDHVTPYLLRAKKWPHEQIAEMSISPSDAGLFFMAARRYREPKYVRVLDETRQKPEELEYVRLLFPAK